jgi:RalA-binding protein 1
MRERQGSQNSLNISTSVSQMSVNHYATPQASSSSQFAGMAAAASPSSNLPSHSPMAYRPTPSPLNADRPSPVPSSKEGSTITVYPEDALKTATTATDSGQHMPPPSVGSTTPISRSREHTSGVHEGGNQHTSLDNRFDVAYSSKASKSSSPKSPTPPITSKQQSQVQVIVQPISPSRIDPHPTHDARYDDPSQSQLPIVAQGSPVSLPDEAKRYYVNMQESPSHSPQPHYGFAQGRNASASPDRRNAIVHDKRSESPLKHSHIAQFERHNQEAEAANERSDSRQRSENGEFLDLDGEDTDSHYDDSINDSGRASAVDSIDPSEYEEKKDSELAPNLAKKKRATAEDFPLPPTTPPANLSSDVLVQQQSQAHAMSTSRPQRETTLDAVDGNHPRHHTNGSSDAQDKSPLSQHPPSMSQVPSPSPHSSQASHRPAFQTLSLTAADLARTTIVVSHSSIRPNDRGKDVLSFVIAVDPGNGRPPWKIEKLYSDVLTLDSRVRAIAGKSLGKKLVSLPEGRLWKDHAPAKVDQRKVRLRVRWVLVMLNLALGCSRAVSAFAHCASHEE